MRHRDIVGIISCRPSQIYVWLGCTGEKKHVCMRQSEQEKSGVATQ